MRILERVRGRSAAAADRVAVTGIAVATAALHFALGLQRYARFEIGSYDLVIFDQAVRGYAGFGAPVSVAAGFHRLYGRDHSVLGDHFSPVLALLAPTYWLHADPTTLLLAQAVLFALAVPLAWVVARRAFGPGLPAYAATVAFALAWPLQQASTVGLHESAFAVPILMLTLERAQAGRWGQAAIAVCGLLLVKEDMGLVVAAFGVLVLLRARRRWLGVALVMGGLTATVLTTRVLIPAFGGDPDTYWTYDALGPDIGSALAHVVAHPLDTLSILVTPDQKWHTLLWVFAPTAFVVLLSPVTIMAVPLLAERLLSANPNYWTVGHHYDAFLLPVIYVGALEAARRFPPAWRTAYAAAGAVVAVLLCAVLPFGDLVDPGRWDSTARTRAARAAVETVPDGAVVEADNMIGPHLTSRTEVLLLGATAGGSEWVVVDTATQDFPFRSVEEQRARVRLLRGQGYVVALDRAGWVVLHRSPG